MPGFLRRQIDIHVDIRHVQHGEDLASGRKHLADISDTILDTAGAGVVRDVHLVEFDIVLRRLECMLSLRDPCLRSTQRRIGSIKLLLALIDRLLCDPAALEERLRAIHLLLGQNLLRALLHDIGIGFLNRPLRLQRLAWAFSSDC